MGYESEFVACMGYGTVYVSKYRSEHAGTVGTEITKMSSPNKTKVSRAY